MPDKNDGKAPGDKPERKPPGCKKGAKHKKHARRSDYQVMTAEQKELLLKMLKEGIGTKVAVNELNVCWRAYAREIRDDDDFRQETKCAREHMYENILAKLQQMALDEDDLDRDLMLKLVQRHEHNRRLDFERRDRKSEREIERLKAERADGMAADSRKVDLSKLTVEQLKVIKSMLEYAKTAGDADDGAADEPGEPD